MLFRPDLLKNQIVTIPREAADYPAQWRGISDAPERVYALGDLRLLRRRKLAIVGSRRTPVTALKLGTEMAKTLSSEFAIVTGTADGGDTAAIEGGLAGGVICVLAGGFSALPQGNLALLGRVAKQGLLLALHDFDVSVRNFSYAYRNKLLAALAEGVVVLGAGEKSGALLTAQAAREFEKPLFALPYPPNSQAGAGCNRLIKEGAYLVENAADIAEKLGVELAKKGRDVALSAEEERLLTALRALTEAHASELAAKTGVPVFKLRAILSSLEVKGLLVSLGGNRYAAV